VLARGRIINLDLPSVSFGDHPSPVLGFGVARGDGVGCCQTLILPAHHLGAGTAAEQGAVLEIWTQLGSALTNSRRM